MKNHPVTINSSLGTFVVVVVLDCPKNCTHNLISIGIFIDVKNVIQFLDMSDCFFFFNPAILQRTTVDVGKVKIQGVATCLYLCMDMCGGIYASVSITFAHFARQCC